MEKGGGETHQLKMDGEAERWLDAWGWWRAQGQQRDIVWVLVELAEASEE